MQVTRVQWNMGINPYSIYTECYGGVPDARGVYHETDSSAVVLLPDGLRMDKETRDAYTQVKALQRCCMNIYIYIYIYIYMRGQWTK